MALEELPAIAYGLRERKNIAVNLYSPGRVALTTVHGIVTLEQVTRYPLDGDIRILVNPERPARFAILVRIPGWADQAVIMVNGADAGLTAAPGTFVALEQNWQANDEITLQFPMSPMIHRRTNRNVQESKAPDGTPVSQEVMRSEYAAITRGPLVYATGLIDGFKPEETIRIPEGPGDSVLEVIDPPAGYEGPAIRLQLDYRAPLTFLPYYEAGGRQDGAWRLTWLQLPPVK
jgi:DUF1680 family protein